MKYILLAFLLGISHLSHSQVYRFRAFQDIVKYSDIKTKEEDWIKADFVVVVNFDKNKVQVYAAHTVDVDLIKLVDTDKDSTGTSITYNGVDETGDKCRVILLSYNDRSGEHVGTLVLEYPKTNITMIFRLKKDD